jgi:hypothetical protein
MNATRPTVSIKNHLNAQQSKPSKAAINGILKRGNRYSFTDYKHEEILEILARVRNKTSLNGAQFSIALGYGDTAYASWCSGARFSRKSFFQVMQKASELVEKSEANEQAQLKLPIQDVPTFTIEQAREMLKKEGYKIQKPITTYEEI